MRCYLLQVVVLIIFPIWSFGLSGVPTNAASSVQRIPKQPQSSFIRVTFSDPANIGQLDYSLEDELLQLINGAQPGSTAWGAVYHWSRINVAQAYVSAYQRGVDVRLVTSDDNNNAAVDLLRSVLPPQSFVECHNGCNGNNIMHAKEYIFSKSVVAGQHFSNVVVQSSANLTASQLKNHNNQVTIYGDIALFDAYKTHISDLLGSSTNLNYYWWQVGQLAKVYFFPRSEGGDTIINVLDNISCSGGGIIRIAMAYFTRESVAQRLVSLKNQGCSVAVVLREDAGVMHTLQSANIPLHIYPADGASIHDKYMVIQAKYNGTYQKYAWTGSHNYTETALENNDETLLKIYGAEISDKFLADWNELAQAQP